MRGLCGFAAALAALGGGAGGCGPAVHNEAAERARQWFSGAGAEAAAVRAVLDRHPESLQAGAVFPDWGYGCMGMDDEAEAAHWSPFMEHGVAHYLATYQGQGQGQGQGQAPSERGEQLVAFLFGVASHQVADEQWHSLSGLREGIMRVLAASTFGGDYARAHDVLDVGGDFALAHMSDLGHMLDKWSVPVDDVLAIYRRMGFSVSRWRMNLCITRQFYAMEAVKRFGRGLFPSYASRAPMLIERLDDYYIGGLYAMATATHDCWAAVADWFATGNLTRRCLVDDRLRRPPPRGSPERLERSRGRSLLRRMGLSSGRLRQLRDAISVDDVGGVLHIRADRPPDAQDARDARDARDAQDAPGPPAPGRQHAFAAHEAADGCAGLETAFSGARRLYSSSPYAGFGTAVAVGDFGGDGRVSAAIGAPYFQPRPDGSGSSADGRPAGAVFVVEAAAAQPGLSEQDVLDADPLVLRPAAGGKGPRFPRFGSALAVVDFNADGIDDLAVGSSGYGASPDARFLGRVDVYLGRRGAGLAAEPSFSLTAGQLAVGTDSPASHQRIGGFLFGADVDGDGFADLVVGAPYHADVPHELHAGRVFGFLSSAARRAPGRGGAAAAAMGAPDFTLVPPRSQAFEWFGFSAQTVRLAAHNATLLLVGAPGHVAREEETGAARPLAGRIYAFTAGAGERTPAYDGLAFGVRGESTQLGGRIHAWRGADGSPLVLFGSPSEHNAGLAQQQQQQQLQKQQQQPQAGPAEPVPPRGWQAGGVRVVDPAQWSAAAAADDPEEIAGLVSTLRGLQSPGHFGRALAAAGPDVWIGEPLSGPGEDGRIHRWRAGRLQCFAAPGAMRGARFGTSIAAAGSVLVVAAPHDSQQSRVAGSVVVAVSRSAPA